MNTSNASSFFQSATAQANAERQARKSSNTLGDPITFPTKLLSICADPNDARYLYVTESGSVTKRITIPEELDAEPAQGLNGEARTSTSKSALETLIYRGHTAPVTCCLVTDTGLLVTGSWDKTIRLYSARTNSTTCLKVLTGHTDFVKCLLYIPALQLLVSGSSDRTIRIWDMKEGTKRYACIQTSKSHPRGIESLAYFPVSHTKVVLFSAGSEGSIRRWSVTREDYDAGTGARGVCEIGEPAWVHDTSIYKLLIPSSSPSSFAHHHASLPYKVACKDDEDEDDDEEEEKGMFTASADGTARHFSLPSPVDSIATVLPALTPKSSSSSTATSTSSFTQLASYTHPDYVRDIAFVTTQTHLLLITACRDECLRIFDTETGALYATLHGHFSEVSGVVVVVSDGKKHEMKKKEKETGEEETKDTNKEEGEEEKKTRRTITTTTTAAQTTMWVWSIGLDCTLRKWPLATKALSAHLARQETWLNDAGDGAADAVRDVDTDTGTGTDMATGTGTGMDFDGTGDGHGHRDGVHREQTGASRHGDIGSGVLSAEEIAELEDLMSDE